MDNPFDRKAECLRNNLAKDPPKAPKAPTIAKRRALRMQQQAM